MLTISADRAVPVVAAVAEALGLPGIGTDDRLADDPEGRDAPRVRRGRRAAAAVRRGARRCTRAARAIERSACRPCSSRPTRAASAVSSSRLADDLERHLHAALAESPPARRSSRSTSTGIELNGLVVVRDGERDPAHPLRPAAPAGHRLRRRLDPRLPGDDLRRAARGGGTGRGARGPRARARDGIAFPQLIATDDGRVLVEVAARIPGGQMADLARHATGVDLVEVALRLGARRGGSRRARLPARSSSRSRSAS